MTEALLEAPPAVPITEAERSRVLAACHRLVALGVISPSDLARPDLHAFVEALLGAAAAADRPVTTR